jgi:hypothetical protein
MGTETKESTETRLLPAGVVLIVRPDGAGGDVRLTVGRHGEVDGIDTRRDRFEAIDSLVDADFLVYKATGPGDGSHFLTDRARALYAPLLDALDATSWETWA